MGVGCRRVACFQHLEISFRRLLSLAFAESIIVPLKLTHPVLASLSALICSAFGFQKFNCAVLRYGFFLIILLGIRLPESRV